METIGQRVRDARGELKRADVARAANVSPSALWRIEGDKGDPRVGTLLRISDALGEHPAWITYGVRP